MAIIFGEDGGITSNDSNVDYVHDVLAALKDTVWSITYNQDTTDITGGGDVNGAVFAAGLYDWTAQVTGFYPSTPEYGNTGTIEAYTGGYIANLLRYSLNLAWPEFLATPANAAAVAKAYVPGYLRWSGSYDCYLDDTTPLAIASTGITAANTAASQGVSARFKLRDAVADDTLTGKIIIQNSNPTSTPGQPSTVTNTFIGSGPLATAGTLNPFGSTGNVLKPGIGNVTFTQSSGQTYTGDCFPTLVSLSVDPATVIGFNVTLRGTGALTVG